MNISVHREDLSLYQDIHGGGYAVNHLDITVDNSLPDRVQRNIVINEVIEAYCRSWHKDAVDELVDLIVDALDQLDIKELSSE